MSLVSDCKTFLDSSLTEVVHRTDVYECMVLELQPPISNFYKMQNFSTQLSNNVNIEIEEVANIGR